MGIDINWKDVLSGNEDFASGVLEDLAREVDALNEGLGKARLPKNAPKNTPVPTAGWKVTVQEDGKVKYERNGEIWIWDSGTGRWTPPPNHPDPNPTTPTGKRLAGPGTY